MHTRLLISLCTLACLLAAPAQAQAPYATPDPAPAVHDDAPVEGIGVSGSWTITVREPDGTLVEAYAFHNALVETGSASLATILAGQSQGGYWVVTLSSSMNPCLNADGAPTACTLLQVDPATPGWEIYDRGFNVLNVSATEDNEVLLSGTFTPNNTEPAVIGEVMTQLMVCDVNRLQYCVDATTGNVADPSTTVSPFTLKVLDAPVDVAPGQTITVEVRIGFASATSAAVRPSGTARVN